MNAFLVGSAVGVLLGFLCLGAAGLCVYYKKDLDSKNRISFPLLLGIVIVSGAVLLGLSAYFIKTKRNNKVSPIIASPYSDQGALRKNVSMDLELEE